ncbi:MAG: LysR family transcriptional regulator [Burkholderiaceae bacterium]
MDLRRLRHVVALAEHASFAQAAEAVHLSQPAFSRSIQSLEEELGVELFSRGQRRITPTPYGKLVVERGHRMLQESKQLTADIRRMKSHEFGEIAVGVGPIPAAVLLEPVLTRLSREHPRIRTRIEMTHWRNLLHKLETDELDFFIADVRELLSSEKLAIQLMPEFEMAFYCRSHHPILSLGPIDPSIVLNHALGSFKFPDITMAEFTQLLEFEGDPRSLLAVQCDNMLTLERVALASDLIIVGPSLAFQDVIAQQRLCRVELTRPLRLNTHFGVVRMRDRMLSPGAELIISMAFDVLVHQPSKHAIAVK